MGPPPKDSTQNFNLIKASEAGGYTNVEFDRDATTADSAKDVQFTVIIRSFISFKKKTKIFYFFKHLFYFSSFDSTRSRAAVQTLVFPASTTFILS